MENRIGEIQTKLKIYFFLIYIEIIKIKNLRLVYNKWQNTPKNVRDKIVKKLVLFVRLGLGTFCHWDRLIFLESS